jgi:hypothetical protein
MPEEFLHLTYISAAIEQMRRETVAEAVRCHVVTESGLSRMSPNDVPEPLAAKAPPSEVDEERMTSHRERGTPANQPVIDGPGRRFAERDDALSVPLPSDGHEALRAIDVVDVDTRDLGDAEPSPVHQLQCRTIAEVGRCRPTDALEQPLDIFDA